MAVSSDDALSVLAHWQAGGELFGFACRRSGGLITQRGHARVLEATSDALAFDTLGGRLDVVLRGATYEFGAPPLFVRDLPVPRRAEGLVIRLENDDRVFLYPGSAPP